MPAQVDSEAMPTTVELGVLGMTCAACVRRIEKAVAKVEGVQTAEVNLVTHRARVVFDPSSATVGRIADAIAESGYEPVLDDEPEADPAAERAARLAAAEEAEQATLQRDVRFAAAFTVPLLVVAMSHGLFAWTSTPFGRWLQLALAAPVVFGPGRRFFRLAWAALKHRSADMNTLVAIGAASAFGYSLVALVAPRVFAHGHHDGPPHLYFEAAAAVLSFVLFGRMLEGRARHRLADAVRSLASLQPKTARRLSRTSDALEEDVPIGKLRRGDLLLVRPGERVPADGVVVQGTCAIDESMLTGESLPVDKVQGAKVFGGTMNQAGAVTIEVTVLGKASALARIVEAVEQAQGSKAPIARLADTVSGVFVPVVLGLATLTLVTWCLVDPTAEGIATALERFVSVLVIACPCALGLATPAAVAVGIGRAAELGVLVKGGAALEAASRVDRVLVDKTGTLTAGRPKLGAVVDVSHIGEDALLRLIASAERSSEHPVARAVVAGAEARGLVLTRAEGFKSASGQGIDALVEGQRVRVGTSAWLRLAGIDASPLDEEAERLAALGMTPFFVGIESGLAGLVAVTDPVQPAARHALEELRALGIRVSMVTGDRLRTARAVGAELGIEDVVAEVLPEAKAKAVQEARARGDVVAMVGDGINDAPALAAAHVGIAVGQGADVAVAASDVALVDGGIAKLPQLFRLARATLRTIRQNLFWAFVYNVVGIPIAAGVFRPWTGWVLSPVLASAAMSLSSVSVVMNSLRLRRTEQAAKKRGSKP